jgi:hypothetical protein
MTANFISIAQKQEIDFIVATLCGPAHSKQPAEVAFRTGNPRHGERGFSRFQVCFAHVTHVVVLGCPCDAIVGKRRRLPEHLRRRLRACRLERMVVL